MVFLMLSQLKKKKKIPFFRISANKHKHKILQISTKKKKKNLHSKNLLNPKRTGSSVAKAVRQ